MMLLPPQEFFAAKEALARFCSLHDPRAVLLETDVAVQEVKAKLPEALRPFMTIDGPDWPDVYAFDFSSFPPAVVVWSDHAIVERWESFGGFLGWIHNEQRPAGS